MNAPTYLEIAIASVNDAFRAGLGRADFGVAVPGKLVMPSGISGLPPNILNEIWMKVRSFKTFNEDNDPYGEHDFGSFDHPEAGTINWKIDYFEDENCEYGSEYPDDPKRSYRVMTIMRANEW